MVIDMKLSFKRGKRATGLASCANPYARVQIKGNRRCVGEIVPPSRFGRNQTHWTLTFAVKAVPTESDPAGFRWRVPTAHFETEAEAREFVTRRWQKILDSFDLYQFEKGTFDD